MIPEEVKKLFESQDIVALATADSQGKPNVVPIHSRKIINETTIWFADNLMKKTAQNIKENNKVCVSFWDPKTKDSYKLIGTAIYHSGDEKHQECIKWLKSINPEKNPKGLVEFKVEEIYTLKPGPDAGKKIA